MAATPEDLAHPEFLVETGWLAAHLGQSDLRILDCTVHIAFNPVTMFEIGSGGADFERGHIPGAQFVDVLSELSDTGHPVPLMAPDAAQFASVMSARGVADRSRVVLYSAQNVYWATRVWWLFRMFGFDGAAVLSGGLQKWRGEGRPIETGPARLRPPAQFTVRRQRALMAGKDEVRAAIGDGAVCMINALPEDQHRFTSGIHYGRPGHIKGSVNLPSGDLLDPETNEFLPAGELRRRFDQVGAFSKRVITYCGGGAAASADAMALVMLGHRDVKLYDGSLLEWSTDPSLPMEVDPVPVSSNQAVIAIENRRLLDELREALAQQAAMSEILQIINSSPGNLEPVFDAVIENSMRLCEATQGHLYIYADGQIQAKALRGEPRFIEWLRGRGSHTVTPGSPTERALHGEQVIHISDATQIDTYRSSPVFKELIDRGGVRTGVTVALRKDNAFLGTINVYRQEVRPFTDKQMVLLQNFAAQAVIAMDNARLLTETRDALEQQTATAEVLQVINSSPGNLAPVFDAMLDRALRLCGAAYGALRMWDGEHLTRVAWRAPQGFEDVSPKAVTARPGSLAERFVRGETVISISDLVDDGNYQQSVGAQSLVRRGNARTFLGVALRKDDRLLGTLVIYRQEVRAFTEKQIALLQNFASQAVIAMENARLLTETREALEQQTATAEVLQVINSSPGELTPVFDAILEKAHSLCHIAQGSLELYDGEWFRAVAVRGLSDEFAEILRQGCPAADNPATRPLLEGNRFAHIRDLAETDYTVTRSAAELDAVHTLLCVPLRRDGRLLGMIASARREVRPFSDKEIALLENFAAQAVIAMDNARLLNEIRRRQAELRVTFDNMGDGVAMFDGEQRLAAWNRNFQELLDLPDDFLAGRPSFPDYFDYLATHGEYGSTNLEAELSRFIQDTEREMRFERTRPDGRIIEVRRNAVPGGGFVLIYADITERKRAEEEIHRARDAAERALRELQAAQASLLHAQKMAALGQLTAGIAHEIKNPLNFVNNFAGLSVDLLNELKNTVEPAMAALEENTRAELDEVVGLLTSNLEKIAEHGKRADGIVTSMLAHSRGSTGERQMVDVNALVEEALNLAYHGARAQDQSFNIALERDLDRTMAPIELVPQEVTRVFLNLFGNGFYAATKRSREAADAAYHPALKVATRDLGDAVEIRVRDNGTGIAPEQREKLFQPFFTTKPTGEGTGLGLSISYDIVTQQHGGTIGVDSAFGEFTEFTIRLPRTHRTDAEAAS